MDDVWNPMCHRSEALAFLREVSERLKMVCIERLSYEKLMKNTHGKDSLFFWDPPYIETEDSCSSPFREKDYRKLKELIDSLNGKVILTCNDCKEIRRLYEGYRLIPVERRLGIQVRSRQSSARIIIYY